MPRAAKPAQYVTKAQAGVKQEKKGTVVERELKKLYAQHGTLNAELLVGVATNPKHPLHQYFEWNDTVAAHRYRMQQATQMLLASKFIVMLKEQQPGGLPNAVVAHPVLVRQLVSPFRGGGFKMRNEVINDAELRIAMVAKKIQTLRHWCDEACDYPELKKIRRSILKILPPK
jgi:hypothetical protein